MGGGIAGLFGSADRRVARGKDGQEDRTKRFRQLSGGISEKAEMLQPKFSKGKDRIGTGGRIAASQKGIPRQSACGKDFSRDGALAPRPQARYFGKGLGDSQNNAAMAGGIRRLPR